MPLGELLMGIGLLGLALGSACAFGWAVVERRLSGLTGAPRAVAFGVLAVLGFFAIHLIPGALGILGRGSVAVASVLLLAAVTRIPRGRLPDGAEPDLLYPPAPSSGPLSRWLAGVGVGLYALYLLGLALDHSGDSIRTTDMQTFHLPNIADWIQTGSFWRISDFVPNAAFGAYPNTSDVLTLGVVMPFRNDFLVHFVNYPVLALAGLALYALGRELAAPAAPSALFAAAVLATPIVTVAAFEGLSDTLMLATFAAGLLFLVRHHRTGVSSDLVLAGVALGLSLGTKWYAVPAVAIAILGWVALSLLSRERPRRVLSGAGLLTGLVAVVGGFWLLRNLVELGNPVFPVEVQVAGVTIFDAPRDIRREFAGFSIAGYIDHPDLWRIFRELWWPRYLELMSFVVVGLWLILPAAGALALWRLREAGRERDRLLPVLVLVGIAVAIALVYVATPYSAQGPAGAPGLAAINGRYVMPAILVGAVLGAWLMLRIGRLRPVVEGLVLLALLDALRRGPDLSAKAVAVTVAIASVAAAAGLLARNKVSAEWLRTRRGGAALACAAVAMVGVTAVQEERYNDSRYTDVEATGRWVTLNAPSGQRIGVAGEGSIVYPMFGPRLRNHVEYVGLRVDGMLRTYRRRSSFRAAVRRGRYDLVLLQRAALLEPGLPEAHRRWLPELGYRLVTDGYQPDSAEPVQLYRAP